MKKNIYVNYCSIVYAKIFDNWQLDQYVPASLAFRLVQTDPIRLGSQPAPAITNKYTMKKNDAGKFYVNKHPEL